MKTPVKKALALVQKLGLDPLLIRLSKAGPIRHQVMARCWEKRDYQSFVGQYARWKAMLDEAGVSVKDLRVLEIGSGGVVGVGYFFLHDGAARWVSSDPYQDPTANKRVSENDEQVAEEFRAHYPAGKETITPEFRLLDAALRQEDFVGKFDLIVSAAVMEHIPRGALHAIFDNMTAYLSPGGLMLHEIDLRDHVNVSNPHHFLKYTAPAWESLVGNSIFYTNRLRASDFKEAFVRNGLRTLLLKEERVPLPADLAVAKEFSAYAPEDLETTVLTALVKKDA